MKRFFFSIPLVIKSCPCSSVFSTPLYKPSAVQIKFPCLSLDCQIVSGLSLFFQPNISCILRYFNYLHITYSQPLSEVATDRDTLCTVSMTQATAVLLSF
ncbi:hypothetical protein X975_01223, partial [Stegodyphus mimosarum]